MLRAAGFRFVKRYVRMTRPLTGADRQVPTPPAGVSIRQVRLDDDADLRRFFHIMHTAFADTPDHLPESFEHWRERISALPRIHRDEWFVAEVDGQAAGVLQSQSDDDHGEGWVKNLAVLAEFRGRGVGGALLRRAFAVYAGNGRPCAGLGVDLTNPTRPYQIYAAAGMRPAYEVDLYQRTVTAA